MKNKGIIRRIDELGRLVVPKEIRRSLRINDGDSVEIFVQNDSIILKKHSSIEKLKEFADLLAYSVYSDLKKNIIITDTSRVITAIGNCKNDYLNKNISDDLIESIFRRKTILEKYNKYITIIDKKINTSYIMCSIVSNGDVKGCVIMFDEELGVNEFDFKMIKIICNFLSKSIED